MSLSPMSHVEFKKVQCRPVDFRGQGPHWGHQAGVGGGGGGGGGTRPFTLWSENRSLRGGFPRKCVLYGPRPLISTERPGHFLNSTGRHGP